MAKNTTAKSERPAEKTFSLITNEKLLALYGAMLKCRLMEHRATALFQSGQLKSDFHASAAREASSSAVAIDLEDKDMLAVTQDDWLPAFVKGMTAEATFRLLGGSASPEAEKKTIVFPSNGGDQAKLLREHASAALSAKNGAITVAFIGGAGSLSKWEKTISAAAKERLPMVFVQFIEEEPEETPSGRRSKHPEALVHGVPSMMVDAADAVAVYRVAYEAIVRARQARGATLLRCGLHSQGVDSIAEMERYLMSKGIAAETHKKQMIASFNRELDLATRFLSK